MTASGIKDYEVYIDDVFYAFTTATTLAVTGRTPGTSHSVKVRARDNAGNTSAFSSPITVVTTASSDTTAPTVPTGLAVGSITDTTATASWTASTDAVGVTLYEVFVNGVSNGTTASTSKAITGLAASTAYTVTVRARDAAGNWSAQTSSVGFSTIAPSAGATPIASWNFNEGSGDTTMDVAGGTRPIAMGSGNWATGKNGGGMDADGGVQSLSPTGLQTAARSMTFWAKYPSPGGTWRWGVDFHINSLDTSAWGIMPMNGDNALYGRVRIGGVNTNLVVANVVPDEWHHYGLTYDGSIVRLYKDGVQVASQSASGTIDSCDTVLILPSGTHNVIDDLRLYTTAITAADVVYDRDHPVA